MTILSSGDDWVVAGDGDDSLNGAGGDDFIWGEGGDNTLLGGTGFDNLFGGDGHDILIGGPGGNQLEGDAGDDTLRGGNFGNGLDGGVGSDLIHGGSGGDQIHHGGDAVRDRLFGAGGDDYVFAGTGDFLRGGPGHDVGSVELQPTTAAMTLKLKGFTTGERIVLPDGTDLAGFEEVWLWLGSGADQVRLDDGGLIYVNGGEGNDSLTGGPGDDLIAGGLGDDLLTGGAGFDVASYYPSAGPAQVSLALTGPQDTGAGLDVLSGFEGLLGSGYGDRLVGDKEANSLDGASGDDTISGAGGDDTIAGGGGFDVLRGGGGDDLIKDEPPAVVSIGPATIIGGAGGDELWDRIKDQVVFAYERLSDSRLSDPDRLFIYGSQFEYDADKIDLSLIDADITTAGDQAFVQVNGGFTGHAGELTLKVKAVAGGHETFVLLDVDGDAKADAKIIIAGNAPLFDDFIL